jgi:hypothetical protein
VTAVIAMVLAAPPGGGLPGCSNPLPGGSAIGQCISDVAGGLIAPVANAGLSELARGAAQAFGKVMQWATAWITTDDTTTGGETIRLFMTGATSSLVPIVATIGLMIAGTRVVLASARAQETARDVFRGLALLALVTAGGATVAELIRAGFDTTATTVIAQASGDDVGQKIASVSPDGATVLVFIISIIGLIVGAFQYVIMIFREPVMALMEGTLPIAAAAAMTGAGTQWLKRISAWILSFAIYKYLAAVIIAAAIKALMTQQDSVKGLMTALGLFVISAAALPSMIRLITPVADAVGSGGGGALSAAAGVASMGALLLRGGGAGGAAAEAGAAAAQGAAGLQMTPQGSGAAALGSGSRASLPAGTLPALPGGPRGGPDGGSGTSPGPSGSGPGAGPGRGPGATPPGHGSAPGTPSAPGSTGSGSAGSGSAGPESAQSGSAGSGSESAQSGSAGSGSGAPVPGPGRAPALPTVPAGTSPVRPAPGGPAPAPSAASGGGAPTGAAVAPPGGPGSVRPTATPAGRGQSSRPPAPLPPSAVASGIQEPDGPDGAVNRR